ncbi:unnamed protein product [Adineta ricciae]|uniref:VWFA domain-containing protein n=1 Tax=Adineta ricciae TaxID=249248 RepID=A0A814I1V6_ADIRI|nr:unnamed protein product [Adineta ricciae]
MDATLTYAKVFETFEDISSEYKLKKIKYNADEFSKFFSQFSLDAGKITCVGFIGDAKEVTNAASQFLNITQDKSQEVLQHLLDDSTSQLALPVTTNTIHEARESLLLVKNFNQVAFLYCPPGSTLWSGPLSPTALAVDYVRYMLDVCERIVVIPPDGIENETNTTNPFQDTVNTTVHLQERSVRPNETISISQLNNSQVPPHIDNCRDRHNSLESRCDTQIRVLQDHTQFLYMHHLHSNTESKKKEIIVSSKDLENSYRNSNKPIDYDKAITYVEGSWFKPDLFSTLKDRAMKVFREFIPDEEHAAFVTLLDEIHERYQSITRDNLVKANEQYIKQLVKQFKDHSCLKYYNGQEFKKDSCGSSVGRDLSNSLETSISDYTKSGTKCSSSCVTVDYIVKSIHQVGNCSDKIYELQELLQKYEPESLQYMMHKDRNSQLYDDIKKSWQKYLQKRDVSLTDSQKDIRQSSINELVLWLNQRAQKTTHTSHFDLNCNFYEINPIIDVEANVGDFKISRKPFQLKIREAGSIENPRLSQLFFVSNKIGYLSLSNFPPGKSSLYYFNFSRADNPELELARRLSSPVTKFLMNEKSNIYFIYDNLNRRVERGKMDERTGCLQAPTPVHTLYDKIVEDLFDKDGSPKVLIHIETACFLYGSDSILFFDEQSNLIEYRYINETMKHVCRRVNEDTYIKKVELSPTGDPESIYFALDVISTGKCILLQCKTSVDIYDLTWTKTGTLPIIEPLSFVGFKSFADQTNTYVTLLDKKSNVTVFLLRGLSATRTLEVHRDESQQVRGFPVLDIFYIAQRKFGPSSDSIGSPCKTQIVLILPEKLFPTPNKLHTYFTHLYTQISLHDMRRIIETRVPIHVATIEESNMFPLQDGRNITNDIVAWKISKDNKTGLIQCITELTRIGSYEQLLLECAQPVKVIAIVGRQSGDVNTLALQPLKHGFLITLGKSYFLNRVTGTRFNVASTRCTDGIWLSVAFLHNEVVVVLDCEGLFSTRRNDIEEMKLCLTLAAVTDVFLLNQDLSFNRHLNQLFSNFAKSCDRVKGSQLFKGHLMMVIRDVSSQDAEGAYVELISNVRQQAGSNRSGYLEKLFGGKIVGQCLHHFENRVFDAEIELVRKMIISLPFRWSTGRDFLESLKLTLAQVHTDDDTVMDIHRLKMAFSRLEREAYVMMAQGGNQFSTCDKLTIHVQQLANPNIEDKIIVDQERLNFTDGNEVIDFYFTILDSDKKEESFKMINTLIQLIENHFDCKYQEAHHNTWLTNLSKVQTITLEHRVAFIVSHVRNQLTNDPTYTADIKDFETALKTRLVQFGQSMRLCLRSCHRCRRLCNSRFDHRDDCNCETDHICRAPCELCNGVNTCFQLYGHEDKHRCNDGHTCGKPCTKTTTCMLLCSLEVDHDNQDVHDCTNRHYCAQKCSQYPKCDKNCAFDAQIDHKDHICTETVCPFSCQILECRRRCIFVNHAHQRLIDDAKKNKLKMGELIIDYHVCENEHSCAYDCIQEGVCSIGYDIIEKQWENAMNTFPYKFYEPKPTRSKCILPIPIHTLTHGTQAHNCKIEHRCGYQCPECRSFCQLPNKHLESYHHTNTHRNKECNVFVSKHSESKSVVIKVDGRSHEYKPGESCKPEICSESCERRGRSHFHLKPCPGEHGCAGKLYSYARHSDDSWYPYQDRKYDLWLCEAYWHSLGWSVPYNDDILGIVNACSFFCPHPSHIDDSPNFCIANAWHSGDHVFKCKHDVVDKLDIVFCCDATGSMSSYIIESKKTVHRIIGATKVIKDVKFRFVAYRDHPPQDTSFVTNSNPENLSDSTAIMKYVDSIQATGGGDGPEAVLDGLNDAVMNTRWRDSSALKYIVHIADAPPHGILYTSGGDHWPAGCPCGLTIEGISASLNDKKIRYKLMKIGTYPNTMASVFKTHITNFEETDLSAALDLSDKFVDILARDLQREEIDVIV